jgi:hypothetical protein
MAASGSYLTDRPIRRGALREPLRRPPGAAAGPVSSSSPPITSRDSATASRGPSLTHKNPEHDWRRSGTRRRTFRNRWPRMTSRCIIAHLGRGQRRGRTGAWSGRPGGVRQSSARRPACISACPRYPTTGPGGILAAATPGRDVLIFLVPERACSAYSADSWSPSPAGAPGPDHGADRWDYTVAELRQIAAEHDLPPPRA